MSITLRYLCKYSKENYRMNLICGESSMDNLVNWVHMLENTDAVSFLHGQELIFTTGVGHEDTEWLTDFAHRLVLSQASGLVLNLGPYIKAVPENLTTYCKTAQFPLFTIPWETRIVDITNDFCRKIIKSEENELTIAGAFRNAIFYPENIAEYRPIHELKEFDPDAGFCVAAISMLASSKERLTDFEKALRSHLNKILFKHSDRFNIFRQDKYLVLVLQDFPEDVIENALLNLDKVIGNEAFTTRAGIGMNDQGLCTLHKNYKRAVSLLSLAEKRERSCISYRSLGLNQLLLEVEDLKVLRNFYQNTLGKLEDYDEKNGTDYLLTLKSYLEHGASVQDVAKDLYVHRNTINYKIKRVREILGNELTFKEALNLLLAFHIKDLL